MPEPRGQRFLDASSLHSQQRFLDARREAAWFNFEQSRSRHKNTGATYFVCWSVSFWPQVLLNRRRKTTIGLTPDFCVLNIFGYICYTTRAAARGDDSSTRVEEGQVLDEPNRSPRG